MGVGDAVGKAVVPAVDKLVEARYEFACEAASRLRDEHPDADREAIADALIRRYSKELGAVGSAAGGAAALPVVGTVTSVGASLGDVAWTITRLGEMVLSIGSAYGHDARSIEERRAWVLSVLGMAAGASSGVTGLAGQVGQKSGVKLVKSIPMSQITRLNRALGGRINIIVKFGTKQGAVRLGRLIPFGVGAVIGGGGNVILVRSVGKAAKSFFDDGLPADKPDRQLVPAQPGIPGA